MDILTIVTLAIVSYVIGSFPTAYLIVKRLTGKDIRQEGTGNVGAMNTARATGKWYLFLSVAVIDALKGVLALYIAKLLEGDIGYDAKIGLTVAAFFVVLGHCYSLYFKLLDGKFYGGKAIATLIGVLLMISLPNALLPWVMAMLIPIAFTGNLFLGQFVGTLALPFIGYFMIPQYLPLMIIIAIPVFIKQWSRVIPMIQGKEPRWYWKKRA